MAPRMAGKTAMMVSRWGGKIIHVPQELVADENVRRLYLGESFTL